MIVTPSYRSFVIGIVVFGTGILLFSLLYSSPAGTYTGDFWRPVFKDKISQSSSSKPQIYNCQDPYRRPGYLYTTLTDYRKTRWIPYTEAFFNASSLPLAAHPTPSGFDLIFDPYFFEPEHLDLTSTPKSWMSQITAEERQRNATAVQQHEEATLESYAQHKDEGGFGWLWGRRLLIVGDSLDRFMIKFFCEELHGVFTQEWHKSAKCEIASFNITLVHWHIVSLINYKAPWWEEQDMQFVAWEDRYEHHWKTSRETVLRGLNGRGPDLILWQSGLWDQMQFLSGLARNKFGNPSNEKKVYQNMSDPYAMFRTERRQAVWQEVRFLASRSQKLVSFLRDEFGEDVPTMYRGLTYHGYGGNRDRDGILVELNRLGRAVAERSGHEVFEWGSILNGLTNLYSDDTHYAKGPASWLWGNMILEYMARSAASGDEKRVPYFEGWEACHDSLVDWGGV